MLRNQQTSTARLLLACCLCLLALSYAMEAKTAWYGPLTALGSDVHTAKALAGVPRDLGAEESAPAPVPEPVQLLSIFLALSAAATLHEATRLLLRNRKTFSAYPIPPALRYSPQLFFRPPPALSYS